MTPVAHLSVVESLDVPEVGLPVEDDPALGPLVRLLVQQLLQVGHTGRRVQVDETQIHLKFFNICHKCAVPSDVGLTGL